ncbi:ZPR1 zinc finger domain-containing protein [Candidatus Woesearchaeota archaeon]|nr:ZPR1 zinc finger domain-containing protein [Candidatus Woesearchaeota archaeon]
MERLEKQPCPVCGKKELTLMEDEMDIPFFGKAYVFSMKCSSCDYALADVEAAELRDPAKYTFKVSNKKDMDVRVVKSSTAIVKIPELRMSVTPGQSSDGYVSNVEGVLQRFKKVVEEERDSAEEEDIRKSAKNLLKKIWKVECGDIPMTLVIEDPNGNSAIISDKAVIEKLKAKKSS